MASRTFKGLLPLLILAAAVVIAGVMIISRPENRLAAAAPRAGVVDVAEVHLQDLRIPIQAQGTVTPHLDTTLVSEVAGKIIDASPSFNAGGFIAKGEMLLKIDDRDYQANVLRAKANVEAANSAMAQETGRAEVARREWEKLSNTTQRSQEAQDLYLRIPQLRQAQAQLLSAQADLRKAENDLQRTIIRAPYDCLIDTKHSDLGKYVTPGTPLARIFAVDYAEVRLAIPQSRLAYLDLPGVTGFSSGNQPLVDLYTDSSGDVIHWPAKMVRTEAALDERSRVLFAVAQVADPYALEVGDAQPLRIGTFVKANILGREMSDLVVLPRYVLRAGNLVWVVDDQLTLRNRKVTTLRTAGDEIYISGGLQQGDLVSLTSLSGAIPGMPVRVNSTVSTLRQQQPLMEAAGAAEPEPQDNEDAAAPDQSATNEAAANSSTAA